MGQHQALDCPTFGLLGHGLGVQVPADATREADRAVPGGRLGEQQVSSGRPGGELAELRGPDAVRPPPGSGSRRSDDWCGQPDGGSGDRSPRPKPTAPTVKPRSRARLRMPAISSARSSVTSQASRWPLGSAAGPPSIITRTPPCATSRPAGANLGEF
jgi:hypothetical protein